MTADADFKRLVRVRMAQTGSTYTQARAELTARHPDDSAVRDVPVRSASVDTPDELRLAADRAFYDRTVRSFFDGERLTAIPSRRRSRVVVLLELLRRFEPGREYAEREVNALLARAHEDVAYLRRELVGFGYLTRTDGRYRIPDALPPRDANKAQEVPANENDLVYGPRTARTPSSDGQAQMTASVRDGGGVRRAFADQTRRVVISPSPSMRLTRVSPGAR